MGSWLVPALRAAYGSSRILATDLREPDDDAEPSRETDGPFRRVDATDAGALAEAIRRHRTTCIYHLAAILSAAGETRPERTWSVNLTSLQAALEAARHKGCALFVPSSVAVFGPGTAADPAPQRGDMRPATMYGVTKLVGELLGDYYHGRFGVDVRGLRFPGLVSHGAPPGGGTTDWAVDAFRYAVRGAPYPCFLDPDTRMDLMYMPDAVRAAMELMEADGSKLRHRNAYNVTAMQLSPRSLAKEIRKHVPDFVLVTSPDPKRQAIADSWPERMDDGPARREWGWRPLFDEASMTREMIEQLGATRSELE